MYARSTTIRGNPQALDEGIAMVRDEVMPMVQGMSGCVGLSMLADREAGRCIVTTAWADEGAMRASAESVRESRDRAAEMFGGTPEVQEWEIALLHRMSEAGDTGCCRLIWSQGDPARVDDMVDAFRMTLLSRMEDLPGFCSCSLLVDRASGRAVTAVTYDSRRSMEAAADQGRAMRTEFAERMGAEITEVAAFDLVLAHLRVPETV
ncbi:antibiotic biosynthesis monooxygenase [Blastococcus sp. SYSU D00820]